jgi:hypothetical protein
MVAGEDFAEIARPGPMAKGESTAALEAYTASLPQPQAITVDTVPVQTVNGLLIESARSVDDDHISTVYKTLLNTSFQRCGGFDIGQVMSNLHRIMYRIPRLDRPERKDVIQMVFEGMFRCHKMILPTAYLRVRPNTAECYVCITVMVLALCSPPGLADLYFQARWSTLSDDNLCLVSIRTDCPRRNLQT